MSKSMSPDPNASTHDEPEYGYRDSEKAKIKRPIESEVPDKQPAFRSDACEPYSMGFVHYPNRSGITRASTKSES